MTTPTVPVTVTLKSPGGAPYEGVTVRARLENGPEIYQGFIISEEVTAVTDAFGVAVLNLFPNAPSPTGLGVRGTTYHFTAQPPGGRRLDVMAQVPNSATTLDAIADLDEAPALSTAQAAQLAAAASAGEAGVSASNAAASASSAAGSASAAATSATNAATSATAAAGSATTAGTQATNAATSATAAAGSATAASTSATNASTAKTQAEAARDAAQTSASQAASSATAAASSASLATTNGNAQVQLASAQAANAAASAGQAATSATAAATSATNASNSATAASGSAGNAAASATTATTQATNASNSATAAAASAATASSAATAAGNSQTQAGTYASQASTSASNAATSASNAATSASTASTAATTATTQAGNAATSATAAASSATTATTQAGLAIDAAVGAAASATSASNSAASASGNVSTALSILGGIGSLNAALAIMLGYANTSTAQAGLAQTYAQQAASVVQQDLSGVTGAALHRSPNPIVQTLVYNTIKDSDGGAWREKCEHLSYVNEALNGAYITGAAGVGSEALARALGGVLGSNLITNNVSDWSAGSNNTLAANAQGGVRATVSAAQPARMTRLVTGALTVGKTYAIYAVVNTNALTGGCFLRAGSSTGVFDYVATNTSVMGGVFRATTTDLSIDIYSGGNGPNVFVDQYSLFVREVTAFAPSGSFYQLATDGKFYRIWKNLVRSSQDLTQVSAWARNNVASVTSKADGVGDLIVANTTAGVQHWLEQGVTGSSSSVAKTLTIRAKAGGYSFLYVNFAGGAGGGQFDLSTGTAYGTGNTMTAVAGLPGYYDCMLPVSAIPSNSQLLLGPQAALNGFSYAGDGVSGIYVAQVQVEYGSASTAHETKGVSETSQTETLRGNTAKFPRLSSDVGESGRVAIYAADQPGRPMWKVLVAGVNNAIGSTAAGPITMMNGCLVVGLGTAGVSLIDFANDRAFKWTTAGRWRYQGNLAQANAGMGWVLEDPTKALASNTVNGVASCILPESGFDPTTGGLQAPLIAVAGPGSTLIKPDGSVATNVGIGTVHNVTLTPQLLTFCNSGSGTLYFASNPGQLSGTFAMTTLSGVQWSGYANNATANKSRHTIARRSGARLSMMRLNEGNPAASLFAEITDSSNTGFMAGDIRRCYLSDVVAGTVGQEMIAVAADRDFSSDTGFWTKPGGVAITGGACSYSAVVPGGGLQRAAFVVSGQRYTVTFTVSAYTAGGIAPYVGGTVGTPRSAVGTYTETIVAGSDGLLLFRASGSNTTATIDNVSCVEGEIADRCYKASKLTVAGVLARTLVATAAQAVAYGGFSNSNYMQEAYSSDLDPGTTGVYVSVVGSIPVAVAAAGWAMDRSAATGAYYRIGHSATGQIVCEVNDGATTRTVTTTTAYNTGALLKVEMSYATSGSLTVKVNGAQAGQATGNPLLTLTNASAVLTVGNRRALDAAWAGSLAMLKIGMTTPSDDASTFMWEQEKEMFRDGAQVTLPDAGSLVGIDYDSDQDKWKVVSAATESSFVGLVRIMAAAPAAGAFTGCTHTSGLKLVARGATNPGVDFTMISWNLREELMRRAEEMSRIQTPLPTLDWQGAFTANTTNGSALVTVTGSSLTIPAGATLVGARVSGTNIPANTTVLAVNGTQVQLSKPCTGLGAGVTVSILDLVLPVGQVAHIVSTAGAGVREGGSFAWTRSFDGFRESVSYISTPGNQWLQVEPRRAA